MISYEPLFRTMKQKKITRYNLIYKLGLDPSTYQRMKHGLAITTKTLDILCFILDCPVSDILEYKRDEE